MFRKLVLFTLMVLISTSLIFSSNALGNFNHASNWALAELTQADSNGLVPDFMKTGDFYFTNEINRLDFCKAVVLFYDKLGGNQALSTNNPFNDVNDPLVTKAYNAGIIAGKSETQFKPLDSLTRQEMCVMIVRALNSVGTTNYKKQQTFQKNYSDIHSISSWAKEAVESMNAHKIINGSDENLDPLGHLTSEQAVIMMNRAYAAFSSTSISQEDQFVIENGVLTKCIGIGDIIIPSTVTSIDPDVFYDFSGLTSITIPGTVKVIPENAFRYCADLTSVTLMEGVEIIGEWSFADCEKLKTINTPSTIKTIETGAFNNCVAISSFTFNEGLTSIGETAFRDSALSKITLPSSLQTLGESAFYINRSLQEVTFNSSSTTIGEYAFTNCNEDLKFNCFSNSTAESYATENDIDIVLK